MSCEIRMPSRKLTDAMCEKVKPIDGQRTIYADSEIPGFELRVGKDGRRSFNLLFRIKGDPIKHRITIGDYPTFKLGVAREFARQYRIEARAGKDPRITKAAAIEAEAVKPEETFAAVAEAFIADHVSKLRTKSHVEAEIRRHLIPYWGTRPIAAITADDIGERIQAIVASGTPSMARLVLAYAKRLFRWAAAPGRPGRLKINPCIDVRAKDFEIRSTPRQVILSADDIRSIWKASDTLAEPFGPFVKALLLTGQRRGEIAGLRWSEVDFLQNVIVLPAERMKAGKPHEIPLSSSFLSLLEKLHGKRGHKGDYVFSTTLGLAPIGGFSKAKVALDKALAKLHEEELVEARAHGLEVAAKAPLSWCFHDLRRTVRTGLGALPGVPHEIRELVIAHVPSALVRTYDLHAYRDEKRAALEAWDQRLIGIVDPMTARTPASDIRTSSARRRQNPARPRPNRSVTPLDVRHSWEAIAGKRRSLSSPQAR